ncbi:MAG: hypothetical protein AAF790_08340, partial [Planctomycetota bacterium]
MQEAPADGQADAATRREAARRRWAVYGLLIAVAVGQMTGRLMAVDSVDLTRLESYRIEGRLDELREQLAARGVGGEAAEARLAARRAELEEKLRLRRPFLSSNDRSRWLAVRALVEHGTFAIDEVLKEPTWDSIDIVQHPDRQGVPRLYSSKPPLLYTLLAGEYWLIHQATGATLGTHPYAIGRAMLFTTNVLPLALMMAIVAGLAERLFDRLGVYDDWPRMFVVACATLGTLLTPFAVVLNNHVVAAVSAAVALYAWARVRLDGDTRPRWFALAGLAAAFTAANELPALSLLVFLGLLLLCRCPRPTLQAFAPAALLVVAAALATNYAAHGSLRPPYMHRGGAQPGASGYDAGDDWYRFTYEVNGRQRQSYWSAPRGVDRGEASWAVYALHTLVGHHGVFSLTPVWLLSIAGAIYTAARGRAEQRELAGLVLALTVVCLAFYIGRPQVDRNYGGMTSGLRWMLWFTPLWLAVMPPAIARL